MHGSPQLVVRAALPEQELSAKVGTTAGLTSRGPYGLRQQLWTWLSHWRAPAWRKTFEFRRSSQSFARAGRVETWLVPFEPVCGPTAGPRDCGTIRKAPLSKVDKDLESTMLSDPGITKMVLNRVAIAARAPLVHPYSSLVCPARAPRTSLLSFPVPKGSSLNRSKARRALRYLWCQRLACLRRPHVFGFWDVVQRKSSLREQPGDADIVPGSLAGRWGRLVATHPPRLLYDPTIARANNPRTTH